MCHVRHSFHTQAAALLPLRHSFNQSEGSRLQMPRVHQAVLSEELSAGSLQGTSALKR